MQPSPARSPRSAFVPLPAPSPLLPSPLFSSPYGSERGAAGGPQPILARRRRSNAARSLPAPTAVSAAATGPPRPRALPPLGRGRGEGSGGGGGVPGGSSAARARPARGIVGRRAAGGGGSGGRRGGVKGQRPPASMAGGASAGGRDRAAPPSPRPVPRRRLGVPRRGTGPGRCGARPPLFPGARRSGAFTFRAPIGSAPPSAVRWPWGREGPRAAPGRSPRRAASGGATPARGCGPPEGQRRGSAPRPHVWAPRRGARLVKVKRGESRLGRDEQSAKRARSRPCPELQAQTNKRIPRKHPSGSLKGNSPGRNPAVGCVTSPCHGAPSSHNGRFAFAVPG